MNLDEIFRLRARVSIFTNDRIGNPRCVAVVEERRADGLTLTFDADDLREAEIGAGDTIQLGFGMSELSMHYTSETTVRAVDGARVVVSPPMEPQKRPRRSYARAPLDWPCQLELAGAGGPIALTGTTLNVSASGALIVLDEDPDRARLDDRAPARMVLSPPDRPPFACTASIVRLGAPGATGRSRALLAVRYLDLPEVDEMRLQLLVLRAIARRYLRCRVGVPCRLVVGDEASPTSVEGLSENLSGSGLLMVAAGALPPLARGQRGTLQIRLEGGAVIVEAAEITRVDQRGERDTAVALSYATIGREARTSIVEFVMERVRCAG